MTIHAPFEIKRAKLQSSKDAGAVPKPTKATETRSLTY